MNSSRPPLSVVVVDLGCLAFAAWTVVCNACVLLGANAIELAAVCGVLLGACALWLLSAARRAAFAAWLADLYAEPAAEHEAERTSLAGSPVVRAVALCAGVLVLARFAQVRNLSELWALALGLFAASYLVLAGERPRAPQTRPRRFDEAALWALALGFAFLTLYAHRSNSDEAFYVNMGVSLADFPQQPLLSRDSLHGTGAPFKYIPYRAASIELLAGLCGYCTRLPTLFFAHLVLLAVIALLTPLALARLLRKLDPERCVYAVAIALLFLLFDGGGRGSYGTFGMTRLYQGKAGLCVLALPLLSAYGVLFAQKPTRARFVMLAAGQIAALGLSVTAFWAAPLAAMFGVASGVQLRKAGLRSLLLGALASSYLVALGLYFKLHTSGGFIGAAKAALDDSQDEPEGPVKDLLLHAYEMVLGKAHLAWPALALVLCCWPLCRTPLARRFAVVLPLAFFALLGNPGLTPIVAAITTPEIHWRVLWLLPVPVFAGLCLSAILEPSRPRAQLVRVPLCAALVFCFIELAPRDTLAKSHFDWPPHPKVDMRAYRVSQALVAVMPPHRQVLAPLAVSRVLPMLNGYGHPLFVKPTYLGDDLADRALRKRLTSIVARPKGNHAIQTLIDGIEHYHVEGVATLANADDKRGFSHALADAGFHFERSVEGHQIWTRLRGK